MNQWKPPFAFERASGGRDVSNTPVDVRPSLRVSPSRPKPCGPVRAHQSQNLGMTKPRLSVGVATASDVVLRAPGLSAWWECSTVVSKNVLSGAYFFGRPTPALFARVLTFTKVACTVLTGSTHSQRSQHLQAAHSFTLANSVALLRGTSPKQAFSISQSVSERCAGTVNTDEITKRIDGFIQQATLSRVLLVPIRVVPGVVWRNVRFATRRAVIPVSHCLCGLRATAFAGWFEWHKS